MADIAALNLAVNSDSVKQATAELREMPKAASAAERAAQKFSATTMSAANSNEQFSRRTQRITKDLEFERQQLLRSSAEREKYAALRRAGVSAMSAEGQAITASVTALQAQRAAAKAAAEAHTVSAVATKAGVVAATQLRSAIGPLVALFSAVAIAQRLWAAGMKASNLGEEAEQIGVSTEQLQAYRFAASQAGITSQEMDSALTSLQKAMGAANDGNKEMIESFTKVGVKLLDARGQLRPVADILPELAAGLLKIDSTSESTAAKLSFFGKAGAKMTTVLEDIAKGNDAVIISAQKAGGIMDTDVIEAWDKLADALVRTGDTADVTIAKLGAPIATFGLTAIEAVLKRINETMDQINSKEGFWQSILSESRRNGSMGGLKLETPEEAAARRRASLEAEKKNPNNAGREAMIQADIDRMNQQESIAQFGSLGGIQAGGAPSSNISKYLPRPAPSKGVGMPAAKGGGSDPYTKAIESAREYTAQKNAETQAIGQNVAVAARMKHEQELINKASEDASKLTPLQVANLKSLAAAMAEADAKFATAKFMDDANKAAEQFIASQQIERDTLFMSAEAAMAYRLEQEALNKAKAEGIVLSDAEKQKLGELAAAQAAAAEATRKTKEMVDFAKDVAKGFFSDFKQGLQDGKTVIESFGDAFVNVLNKIADKLMQMAVDKLFEAAFGGAAGGAGGGAGGLGGWIGSLLGLGGGTGISNIAPGTGGMTFADALGAGITPVAKGGAFDRGNIIPFARGGIVDRPMLFPMARGTGLMGEAGPEGVLPLRRVRGGRLGVEASGGGSPRIVIEIAADSEWVRATARDESGQVVARSSPAIVDKAVAKSAKIAPRAVERDKQMRTPDWRLGSV